MAPDGGGTGWGRAHLRLVWNMHIYMYLRRKNKASQYKVEGFEHTRLNERKSGPKFMDSDKCIRNSPSSEVSGMPCAPGRKHLL